MTKKQDALYYMRKAISMYKDQGFDDPTKISDEQSLGILISQVSDFDGDYIFDTVTYALEDSNYHELNDGWSKAYEDFLNRVDERVHKMESNVNGVPPKPAS